jgi:hypothetical protein
LLDLCAFFVIYLLNSLLKIRSSLFLSRNVCKITFDVPMILFSISI